MAKDLNGKDLPKGITQRKDGRYMGRFEYKGERFTFYNLDLRLLKKEMQDKRYEVEHGLYAKESNITVDGWFKTWMKQYKENSVKAGTIQTYNQVYDSYIKPAMGRHKLKDIRAEMVQTLINDLYKRGLSKTRVTLPHIILLGMFRQAMKNGLVMNNPADLVTLPKFTKKQERRVLSLEEQKLFLQSAAGSIYYNFYLVALGTGMRCGEILGLQWQDIDLRNKVLHVNGTLVYRRDHVGRYKDTPKTENSRREIPLLDSIVEVFKTMRKEQLQQKMKVGDKWEPEPGLDDMVFTDAFGKAVWDTSIRKDMGKIVQSMQESGTKFEPFTPHTFRHTFATRGLENGIQPKVMQTILGHSTLSMTMDLYSHVLPDTKANEIQKIANLF